MEVNERDKEKRWREYRDVLNDDNSGVTNIKSVLSHQKNAEIYSCTSVH